MMEMRDYYNSPTEERNATERCDAVPPAGLKVYRLVGVSFGLLCILQTTLNISLRLQAQSERPGNVTSTSADHDLLEERERLMERFSHQADEMEELREEIDRLVKTMAALDQSCRRTWIPYRSSKYLLSLDQKTWMEAFQDCVTKGGHLVTINSRDEQDFLGSLTKHVDTLWIGLAATDGTSWTWVDGQPLTASSCWEASRFFSRHPGRLNGECVYYDSEIWDVDDCGESHRWICEKENQDKMLIF